MRPYALIMAALGNCFAIRHIALRDCKDMESKLPEKGDIGMRVKSAERRRTVIVQSSLKGNLKARKVRGTCRALLLSFQCQICRCFTLLS